MKQRKREGQVRVQGQQKGKDPIEDFIQLQDYVVFENLDGTPGAALLHGGKDHQFRFGFFVEGIHPTIPLEQFNAICSFIEDGVKAIPEGETFTLIQSVKPDNARRLHYYRKLAAGAPNRVFAEMVKSAASFAEYFPKLSENEIKTRARLRYKKKTITLYVTCTPSRMALTDDKTNEALGSIVSQVLDAWRNLMGEKQEFDHFKLQEVFQGAQAIYEDWINILSRMRLGLTPMSVEEMAQEQWEEFNHGPMRELPQVIHWDGYDLKWKMQNDLHLSSWFFDEHSSVPKAARDYVYQKDGDRLKYTGVVTLRNKPTGWRNHKEQLLYLYEKATYLEEYKIVFSATKAPEFLVRRNVELIQRQAKDAELMAEKRNLPATRTEALKREANAAAAEIHSGNVPLKTSLCFVISKHDKRELALACRKLKSRFLLPASLEVESDYVWMTWLQCFPQLSYKSPLFKPYDRSRSYMSSVVAAFMPIVKVTSPDTQGIEFITEAEGTPYYLDIARVHRHILYLAITRSGKSVLFAQILLTAMCSNIPLVVVDYPRDTGESTFGPITRLAGNEGAYLNIAEESNNFLEAPDLSQFTKEEQRRRLTEVKDYVLDTMLVIMYGGKNEESAYERRSCRVILGNLINLFYDNPDIKRRFKASAGKPVGSSEWQDTPTLRDFTELCTLENIEKVIEDPSAEHRRMLQDIKLRFSTFVETTVGRSMSQPTTIPSKARLLVFAFKNVNSDDDAAILMSSATAAAMRRTLSSPVSFLFLDEASILSKFESLMAQVAKIAANGAKSGIGLSMALQTPASIAKSKSGDEILANITTRIIGRVNTADAENYSRILKIPADVIKVNTSKTFFPVASELYSKWLISERGDYFFVRSYAPPLLLAAVANNTDEEAAKAAFVKKYGDPVIGLKQFAIELILSFQEGRPINVPELEEVREVKPNKKEEYAIH